MTTHTLTGAYSTLVLPVVEFRNILAGLVNPTICEYHPASQAWIQDAVLKLKASTRSQIEMVEDGGGSGALLPERHPRSDESPSEDIPSQSPALSARTSALLTPSRAGTSLTALEPEVSSRASPSDELCCV